jgi:SAM-dependent methyltransferase
MMNVEKALLYEEYRLPYAPELVDGLLGQIGEVKCVADIGAGTGQLARMFADRSARVYAVEPDPAMRDVASTVLEGYPNIEIVPAYAEETTLAENSVDLIVVGNAFHRFQPEAREEFRRILKREAWIALVTYIFLNKAFTDMLFSKLSTLNGLSSRMDKAWHSTPIEELFGSGRIHQLSYRQSRQEDWTAFWGAACAGIEAPEKGDPEYAQFEAINRQVFDAFAVDGLIQVDYETRVSFGQPSL